MDFLTVVVVGLTTGLLASLFAGGALSGIVRNLVNGALGAFLASWLVAEVNSQGPTEGSGGAVLVALVGAAGLLLSLRAAQYVRRGWDRANRGVSRSRSWRSVPRALAGPEDQRRYR